MIRIFHTADWHLGQLFHGYDRDYEHARFLEWLLATIKERGPDVLLISGDIHDTINPSAVALSRFYGFLAQAHAAAPRLRIVLIAGNHDAAARLEAPSRVLESLNVRVIGTVSWEENGEISLRKFLVPLQDASGAVRAIAIAIPYLRPSDVPRVPHAKDPHLEGVRELYRRAVAEAEQLREREYPGAALIALGHCHMQGAAQSKSERPIVIGNAELLHTDTFSSGLAYVALGHLHKPQEIEFGRIYYSGSPIPLSFSEREYEHRVLELRIEPGQPVEVKSLPVPVVCPLLRMPETGAAPIDEVLALLENLPAEEADSRPETYPYLEVNVLEDGPDPTRRARIRAALEGKAVRLGPIQMLTPARSSKAAAGQDDADLPSLAELDTMRPEEILESHYRECFGGELPADLREAFREILATQQITVGALP